MRALRRELRRLPIRNDGKWKKIAMGPRLPLRSSQQVAESFDCVRVVKGSGTLREVADDLKGLRTVCPQPRHLSGELVALSDEDEKHFLHRVQVRVPRQARLALHCLAARGHGGHVGPRDIAYIARSFLPIAVELSRCCSRPRPARARSATTNTRPKAAAVSALSSSLLDRPTLGLGCQLRRHGLEVTRLGMRMDGGHDAAVR